MSFGVGAMAGRSPWSLFLLSGLIALSTLLPFILFESDRQLSRSVPLPRFPASLGPAGRLLLSHALRMGTNDTNDATSSSRCSRYFSYENNTRLFLTESHFHRRLFLGSLLADDSWHSLAAVAIEAHNLYTAIAFVESNRSQTATPRPWRFWPGSNEYQLLVHSNLFGTRTQVMVDYYTKEESVEGGGIVREQQQRHLIVDMWRRAGMTRHDVGIIADADETPSRDFLLAVQTCYVPELDEDRQDCRAAKLTVASNVFEGSPECMVVTRKWMHPDMILGKCVDGIGDETFRLTTRQRAREFAWRKEGFSAKGNYTLWPKNKTQYPLWNPADFRRDTGGEIIYFEYASYLPFRMGHTGFHFHNYFETIQQLRTKYRTYGHPVENAHEIALEEIHPDLGLMIDCVLGKKQNDTKKHRTFDKNLTQFEGRIPIAYRLEGYTRARHLELRDMLEEEERNTNLVIVRGA